MKSAWEIPYNPEVVVAIPHKELCSVEWALHFKDLKLPENRVILGASGYPIDQARNYLVMRSLQYNSSYILFIDTDVLVKKDTYYKLKKRKKLIVSALYFTRWEPIVPCMWEEENKPITNFNYGDLVKANLIGLGCCLIDMKVFKELEPPYFKWVEDLNNPSNIILSEDFYFCKKCRERGIDLYVDTSHILDHVGLFKYRR